MKLSTRSRYGTRILMELARHSGEGPIQGSQIAEQQNIPLKYMEQLLRTLRKAEMVRGIRGARGGYLIAREPERISIGQVVRLFEWQAELTECISAPETCPRSDHCPVRTVWQDATNAMYQWLDGVSIADLLVS